MTADPARRRRRQLELAVFLLFLLPGIVLAQLVGARPQQFALASAATILHDLALTALAVFFVWSGAEPLASLGWTRRRAGREAALGALLYLPMLGLLVVLGWLLYALGVEPTDVRAAFVQPRGLPELALATAGTLGPGRLSGRPGRRGARPARSAHGRSSVLIARRSSIAR